MQQNYEDQEEEGYLPGSLVSLDPKNCRGFYFIAAYSVARTTAYTYYIMDGGTCPLLLADDALQCRAMRAGYLVPAIVFWLDRSDSTGWTRTGCRPPGCPIDRADCPGTGPMWRTSRIRGLRSSSCRWWLSARLCMPGELSTSRRRSVTTSLPGASLRHC